MTSMYLTFMDLLCISIQGQTLHTGNVTDIAIENMFFTFCNSIESKEAL